jgi:hypothetical protein
MAIKKSAVTLEIIAGVFGWIWIACTLGFVVAVGGALFSDWSWLNAVYLFVVGGVAKWLARGFEDNKKRVLFENQLISRGASKEEASEAWTKAYLGEESQ